MPKPTQNPGDGSFNRRLITPISSSIDGSGNTVYYEPPRAALLYNVTPTTDLATEWQELKSQETLTFLAVITGSDGNPPQGTGSIEHSIVYPGPNGDPSSTGPLGSQWLPTASFFRDTLTGSGVPAGATGLAFSAKYEQREFNADGANARWYRFRYTASGAGSGSLFVDMNVKAKVK